MPSTRGGRITHWDDPTINARHGLRRLTYDPQPLRSGCDVGDHVSDPAPLRVRNRLRFGSEGPRGLGELWILLHQQDDPHK